MDPDKQSDLGLQCLLERLLKHFSRRQNQTTVVIGVLRVKLSLNNRLNSSFFILCNITFLLVLIVPMNEKVTNTAYNENFMYSSIYRLRKVQRHLKSI